MSSPFRICEECGAGLPGNAPQGLCPHCLARMAVQVLGDNPGTVQLAVPAADATDRIGRYKLLQKIGEGGCGVVYMAEQAEPVCRRVALKVIKPGMDTKQVIARFEAERQALAMMDHPNIAKVLDAGATDTGRPYFVMELVRGIKITDYCDQNQLATGQRLELFLQVCKAIQHAHQKGIIHRDIKPSNILVTLHDGLPVPKVIDFGIAKATQGRLTDQTLFTALEQFIGTPAYMSPEQAELSGLDIDTRSDIYSLGVLLYELLTGKMPFDAKELAAAGLDKMRRTIREKEPVRPSSRLMQELASKSETRPAATARQRGENPKSEMDQDASRRVLRIKKLIEALRGDLDWIVMKCLEKDRTRRYETANGLASDLQRYLNTEPVAARPPSQSYRFQKLVRRNKLAFGAAVAIAAALILGMGLTTGLSFKERQTRQRAETAEKEQSRLRGEAETKRQAEAGLRQKAQANEKLAQTEAAKSRQVARFLQDMLNGVGPSVAMGRDPGMLQEILDRTARRIDKDLPNQPEVEAELRTTIGLVYIELGDNEPAEAMLRRALTIQREGVTPPRPQIDRGKTNVERPPSRWIWLGDEDPSVAASLYNLGIVLSLENKIPEAKRMFEEALAINRKLTGSESRDAANCLDHLASLADGQGELVTAEALARQALTMKRKLFVRNHPDIATSLMILASVLNGKNEFTQAESLYREALEMNKKVFNSEHLEVAICVFGLGATLHKEGKLSQSEELLREALARSDKLFGREHYSVIDVLSELAAVLSEEGKPFEAEEILERKEALLRSQAATALKSSDKSPEKISEPVLRLAGFLQTRHKYAEAEQVLNQALTPATLSQPKSAALLSKLADLHGRTGRWKDAAADLSRPIEINPEQLQNYLQLAPLLVQTGDVEGYRRLCAQIRMRFDVTTNDSDAGIRMAVACQILPSTGTNLTRETRLADAAFAAAKGHPDDSSAQFCKGLTEYRQEHPAQAAACMEKVLARIGNKPDLEIAAYMVLAMAQHQLTQLEQTATLAKGIQIAETKLPKIESGDIGDDWTGWLIAHSLMREARDLIKVSPRTSAEPGNSTPPLLRREAQ